MIWRQFTVSLVSPTKVAGFINTKKRHALAYMSFMLLVCLVPTSIISAMVINSAFSNFHDFMKSEKVPSFVLKNGTLTSDAKQPILTELQGTPIIFDTTGEYTQEKAESKNAGLAILKDRVLINNGGQSQVVLYKNYSDLTLTKKSLNNFLNALADWKWLLIVGYFLIVFTFRYFMLLFITLILAVIGIGINTSLQQRVKYARIWVLTIFTVTLPTAIFEAIKSIGVVIPAEFILYFFICSVMLFFVLREVSYRAPVSSD